MGVKFSPIATGLLNLVLWIVLLLFVFPTVSVLWLYNKFVEHFVTIVFKRNCRPLNHLADTIICLGDSYRLPSTNCAQVWVVSGKWISAEEYASHFHYCFLEGNSDKYKNLYAHVTIYGSYCFFVHCKPEQLDLKWHIREYSLSDFGHDGARCSLESFCAAWMTTNTYEEGRPPWQIAIIHLGDPESGEMETGIIAKFSHALVDGYSFIHMVGKLADNPAPYLVQDRSFNWMDKIKCVYNSPKDLVDIYGKMAFSIDSRSPFRKEFGSPSFSPSPVRDQYKWFMSLATLDLSAVKRIRKATGTHFFCLMICTQLGAFRKLMLERTPEAELPKYLWVTSSLPWPNHPHSLTNHFTMGLFKCPLRIADPAERLRWLEANYINFKQVDYDVKLARFVFPILRVLPAWARRLVFHHDLLISNIPQFFASLLLSEKQHYLLGRKVKNLYLPLIVPDILPCCVVFGATTSHSGQVDLSIAASSAIVKNQDELDRLTQVYFIEELESIAYRNGLNCSLGNNVTLHFSKEK